MMDYSKATLDEVFSLLSTSRSGLTSEEAKLRLEKYGYNEVKEKKESPLRKFLSKFSAPVPWMLEVTAVVTFLLRKYDDMGIILFLLIFNAIVSFVQESRAESAVELLRKKLSVQASVLRNGEWKSIPARELVPGDIIHVRLGDIVPADVKVIDGEVEVDQSALTGESISVERKVGSLLYSGSVIKRGEAYGVVVNTGVNTYFGKTTELVQSAKVQSHIESLILGIVKYLITIDVALVLLMSLYSFLTGVPLTNVLPFALVVLIASIPVALPATFTIAMAIGALEMSKKGVLVTRLNAIEDASSMDVLCMDKTGTITENKLYVIDPIVIQGKEDDLIRYAVLASEEVGEDPIDKAIINYAKEKGIKVDFSKRKSFTPFDPSTKRSEGIVEENGKEIKVVKGAPQVVGSLCGMTDQIKDVVDKLALRGFRVIAVGKGEEEKLNLVGLLPLLDRPRKDSPILIHELKDLGVSVKMITGDNKAIAGEIAKEVGITDRPCAISDVKEGKEKVDECGVFAEVFPEDKFFVVKSLQSEGHVTGMTGDGVNDAPALKQAEVGIAVSNATDVAKAAASIVLTHEGITDIVDAVKSGRKIYQRMLTYTLNKIMKTIQVVIFLTTSFFVFRFFVTTPFDIILLLFANDFVTMSIATDNVRYSKSPEKWSVKPLITSSAILSSMLVLEGFVGIFISFYLGLNHIQIQTFVFDLLVFSGLFTVLMIRERKRFWHSSPSKWLSLSIAGDILVISLISVLGILVTPVPFDAVLFALGLAFTWMIAMDTVKNFVFRKYNL
ncbi:plasma-membrane proton-efflux P-type ATPase [Sulfuracidifex metallicus]